MQHFHILSKTEMTISHLYNRCYTTTKHTNSKRSSTCLEQSIHCCIISAAIMCISKYQCIDLINTTTTDVSITSRNTTLIYQSITCDIILN